MSNIIININGVEEFESSVLLSKLPVLVDFWAPWCGPCKMVMPELDAVAEKVQGKAIVAKVNVDENADLAKKFAVRGVPTFLLVKEGKEMERLVGANTREALLELLKKYGA